MAAQRKKLTRKDKLILLAALLIFILVGSVFVYGQVQSAKCNKVMRQFLKHVENGDAQAAAAMFNPDDPYDPEDLFDYLKDGEDIMLLDFFEGAEIRKTSDFEMPFTGFKTKTYRKKFYFHDARVDAYMDVWFIENSEGFWLDRITIGRVLYDGVGV